MSHSNGFETRLRLITVAWTFSRSSRTLLGAGSICIYNVNKEPVRTALRKLRNRRRLHPTRVPKDVGAAPAAFFPLAPHFPSRSRGLIAGLAESESFPKSIGRVTIRQGPYAADACRNIVIVLSGGPIVEAVRPRARSCDRSFIETKDIFESAT